MEGFRGLGCQRVEAIDCDVSKENDHGLVSSEMQPTRLKPRTSWILSSSVHRAKFERLAFYQRPSAVLQLLAMC